MSDQEAQAVVQELRSSLHVDVLREQEKLPAAHHTYS